MDRPSRQARLRRSSSHRGEGSAGAQSRCSFLHASAGSMAPIKTIDSAYRRKRGSLSLPLMTMGDGEAILYGSDECSESKAMAELLSDLGVEFRFRLVNRDAAAQSEWEQLDGEKVPMLRMGNHTIIRGLDRIRIQQLFGWVGC